RGTNTPWFRSLVGQEFVNPITSGLTWAFAYITSIFGLIVLSYENRGLNNTYIASLYLVGLVASLGWDVIFFYGRDIKFSLVIYVFIVLFYAWFFYEVYQLSVLAAFFEVFLLLRSIYFFFQVGRLLIDNPSDTIIPF
ncbi:MAG: tryptophan-rich sensory protein, partial [Planktothrix sp.]